MNKHLTVILQINAQPVEHLTTAQLNRLADLLSASMSEYYARHPDDYRRLTDALHDPPPSTAAPTNPPTA